jgi:tripartite-type tricarboxylate transporter receptor subunit TctC
MSDPRSILSTAAAGRAGRPTRRAVCLAAAALLAGRAAAQDKSRPVLLVVPFAPGGVADVVARPFAVPLARELGTSVVIDNRAGAGGAIGMAHVARQKPDGNTLLMALSSIVVIPEADKVMGRAPSYTLEQLQPVALVTADPTVLAVRADSRWKTTADLVREAKAKPKTLTFSSSGIYGTTHVAQAMLWQAAGVELVHVPYSGGGPSMQALLAGQVDITAQGPSAVSAHVKSGAVRLLGGWGAQRLVALPDVPTLKEQGFDVEFYIWSALFAPAGLAPATLEQLRAAARKSATDPAFVAAMKAIDTPVRHLEGAELQAFIEQDQRRLARVVKAMGKLE